MDDVDDLLEHMMHTDPFEALLLRLNARLATEERIVDVDKRHIRNMVHEDPARRDREDYEFVVMLLEHISDLYAQEPPPEHALYTFAYRYPFAETLTLVCTQRMQHITTGRLMTMESLLNGR